MTEEEIQIQMFGGFAIRCGKQTISINKADSSKSIRLLQMLLLSLPAGLSKSEIMDTLYVWSEKADAASRNRNLNNLIYRLKKQLAAGGLPPQNYVEIAGGICRFHTDLPLWLDVLEFQKLVEKARGQREDKVDHLWRANEIYGGELLSSDLSDTWFFRKSKYYKELYVWSVKELEKELQKRGDHNGRLRLYARAASIYPFGGWQLRQMRCNLELYRYDEALDIYRETTELYAREMAMAPPREMQECFESLKLVDESHRRSARDVEDFRNMDKAFQRRRDDIRRALCEETVIEKAYYCAYPSFVDYCRLVVRAKERNQFSAVLMFLTLSQKKERRKIDISEEMDLLKEVLKDALRVGDAFTRYGSRHFILMLMKTEMEYCNGIFSRVEAIYGKRGGKGDLWYYADMTQELKRTLV